MGKLVAQAEWEVNLSADILDYYADNGEAFLADKNLNPESGEAIIRNSPIGVLFGVMPWNFPFIRSYGLLRQI
jgi:succinate-semialdehyde dehydrogenase/glutarate-semialdehyde dehydrogenase